MKVIHNPVEVVIQFNQVSGNWEVSGWVKYQMTTTEYPDLIGKDKMVDFVLTQAQKTAILNFATSVIYPQIRAVEEL